MARARGAVVTATASAARHDFVRRLGASSCIDYRHEPMTQWPGGFDAVLDCVPSIPRPMQRSLLAPLGHYVTTVPGLATFLLDPIANRLGSVQRHGVMLRPDASAVDEYLGYLAQGRLRPSIEQVFPLHEARPAIERSRAGHVQGKIVLQVD